MSIYWRQKYTAGQDMVLSGVRSTEPLHACDDNPTSRMNNRSEIMVKVLPEWSDEPMWMDFWIGHPGECHDMLKAAALVAACCITAGATEWEAYNYIEDLVYMEEEEDYRPRTLEEWKAEVLSWTGVQSKLLA